MTQSSRKHAAIAISASLAGGLMLSGSAFAVTPMVQGYLLGAQQAAADKAQEGKCGEGKCGAGMMQSADKTGDKAAEDADRSARMAAMMAAVDTDGDGRISRAEFEARHPDRKERFDGIDTNGDGFIDADERAAHHAAMHEEGQGEAKDKKADMEGKCGEGKCGGMA